MDRRCARAACLAALLGVAGADTAGSAAARRLQRRQGAQATLATLHRDGPPGISTGHYLTESELAATSSVECLQMRQLNPSVSCGNYSGVPFSGRSGLGIGNYPLWSDGQCHSHGAFFCDPENIIADDVRASLAQEIRGIRNTTRVDCGAASGGPAFASFSLGVAVARSWPTSALDQESLQTFGRIITSEWQMNPLHVGPGAIATSCPNVGMLLIFVENRQAFLSTPSCEFICQERGGADVVSQTLSALDGDGVAAAVRAGVQEVAAVLARSPPLSSPAAEAASQTEQNFAARAASSAVVWDLVQRMLFFVVAAAAIVSILVGIFVIAVSPKLIAGKRWG